MKKREQDKVFDNDYNTGNLDNFSTENIVLSETYKRTFLRQEYDSDTDYRLKQLGEELYEYIKKSKFEKILNNRKLVKRAVPEILEYLLPYLDEKTSYTFAEKFFVICEILNIKENIIYENLPIEYQDKALREIQGYSKLEKRTDSTKLF